jgi:hypothetical protein
VPVPTRSASMSPEACTSGLIAALSQAKIRMLMWIHAAGGRGWHWSTRLAFEAREQALVPSPAAEELHEYPRRLFEQKTALAGQKPKPTDPGAQAAEPKLQRLLAVRNPSGVSGGQSATIRSHVCPFQKPCRWPSIIAPAWENTRPMAVFRVYTMSRPFAAMYRAAFHQLPASV